MKAIDYAAVPEGAGASVRPLGPVSAVLVTIAAVLLMIVPSIALGFALVGLIHPGGFLEFLSLLNESEDGLLSDPVTSERFIQAMMFLVEALTAATLIAVAAIRSGREWRQLVALRWSVPARPLLIGLVLVAVYSGVGTAIEQTVPSFKEWLAQLMLLPEEPAAFWMAALGIIIVAPVSEEIAFRGFIFTAFRKRWGFLATLVITSALFALLHFDPTLLYAALVFPMALVLGWTREVSGSIVIPIMLHITVNLLAFLSVVFLY